MAVLRVGANCTTPCSVKTQVIPMIPAGVIDRRVQNGVVYKSGTHSIDLEGITGIGERVYYYAYQNAVYIDPNPYKGPAFVNAEGLTCINNAYSLYYSFQNSCVNRTGLTSVQAINGVDTCYGAFSNCSYLVNTDLSNLTKIGDSSIDYACSSMFNSCTNLTDPELHSLVSITGSSACSSMFNSCTNLKNARLSNLTQINGSAAAYYMFNGCTNLTTVDLGHLTSINGSSNCATFMFNTCTNLTSVNLSSLSTIMGTNACQWMFNSCTNLTDITVPNSIDVNGMQALYSMFSGCRELSNTTVFDSITSLSGANVCYYMYNGTNVSTVNLTHLNENCTIASSAMNGFSYAFSRCANLTSVVINPTPTLKFGPAYMFTNCINLPSTCLQNVSSITTYSAGMFQGCTNLIDAGVDNLQIINGSTYGMFINCTSLPRAIFSKLQEIGSMGTLQYMFSNCTGLSMVKFPALTTITNTSKNIFNNMLSGVSNCTVIFSPTLQPVIGDWASVTSGFGGTNITVNFNAGIDLPVNIPQGYRVWANDYEITNEANFNFLEGDNNILFYYEDQVTPSNTKFGSFVFTATSESTEFTFDPTAIVYCNTTIDWNTNHSTTYPTTVSIIYTFTNGTPFVIDLGNYSVGTYNVNVSLTPGIAIKARGSCEDKYIEDVAVTIPDSASTSINLTCQDCISVEYTPSELLTIMTNTMTGSGGLDLSLEMVKDIEYLKIHSTSTSTNKHGYILYDTTDSQLYSRIMVEGSGFVDGENGWDFGYIAMGPNNINPGSYTDIKNNTMYQNDLIVFKQTGEGNSPTPFDGSMPFEYGGYFYINIGWIEDTSGQRQQNFWLSKLKVTKIIR